ncbi:MAG: hypothetical protein DRI61_16200 [Chloroflexi bacterium]|nr:MAG: hypothetical protein DRI61_16200 [Chloroflexota bacterium]
MDLASAIKGRRFKHMDAMSIWYWASSICLAAILFRPAKKVILIQRVRRTERKLDRQLTEDERQDLEKRTIPMTVFIVVTFSFLFNSVIMNKYY